MIATIKDYLLTVLVRAIIGYVLFLFFLLVIFVGYIVISDWASAVNFITGLTDNGFAKIVVWLPLVFSLFKADARASNETKKFYKQTEHFFEMYDTTGGKW
ncbi:hypothetical protein CIG1485E_a0078 (plasmid) [Campylobacter iguaniorum]|uniref:Uncharacterized protein n=1 Tax=Campylobacter iguaniorum TaxID=1244531 RepID=A0A076FD68_9BACT|nr:hypothetical protein [Campylobacter iguaniorum]AII15603.1 hypothetical protein CIG1485E_a0078 [Campylobacter iguaniorum]